MEIRRTAISGTNAQARLRAGKEKTRIDLLSLFLFFLLLPSLPVRFDATLPLREGLTGNSAGQRKQLRGDMDPQKEIERKEATAEKRGKGKAIEQSKTHRNGTGGGQAPGIWVSPLNPGPYFRNRGKNENCVRNLNSRPKTHWRTPSKGTQEQG